MSQTNAPNDTMKTYLLGSVLLMSVWGGDPAAVLSSCSGTTCGCATSFGFIKVGAALIRNNCTEFCTCEKNGGDAVCSQMECPPNMVCMSKDGGATGDCECDPPYHFNGEECAHLCSFPKYRGPCNAKVRRWYFNIRSRRCYTFLYGGCGSTPNMFETATECENACSIFHTPSSCLEEEDPGPCVNYTVRYTFHAHINKCREFLYGGCEGNDNNFETMQLCQINCMVRKRIKPGPHDEIDWNMDTEDEEHDDDLDKENDDV